MEKNMESTGKPSGKEKEETKESLGFCTGGHIGYVGNRQEYGNPYIIKPKP